MMTADQQNLIRSRVLGREVAGVALGLARDEAIVLGPVSRQSYWEHIHEQAAAELLKLNPPEGPEIDGDTEQPMNDEQSRKFGRQPMPFGVYYGKQIDDVPASYLMTLVDDTEFKKKLRRYLASPRIKSELSQSE